MELKKTNLALINVVQNQNDRSDEQSREKLSARYFNLKIDRSDAQSRNAERTLR